MTLGSFRTYICPHEKQKRSVLSLPLPHSYIHFIPSHLSCFRYVDMTENTRCLSSSLFFFSAFSLFDLVPCLRCRTNCPPFFLTTPSCTETDRDVLGGVGAASLVRNLGGDISLGASLAVGSNGNLGIQISGAVALGSGVWDRNIDASSSGTAKIIRFPSSLATLGFLEVGGF
jgi:hypothetical protein